MAAAVGFLRPGAIDWAKLGDVNGDYALPDEVEDIASFLVDLKKDRVLAVLRGKHYGTKATYNHERYRVAWSDDGRYLVESRSWKWHTESATLYALNGDGAVPSSMDLLPVAKEQLRIVAERDHKVARQKFEETYVVSLWKQEVDSTGQVTLEVVGEVPKSEEDPSVSLLIRFTVKADDKGRLSLETLKVEEKKTGE